MPIQSIAIVNAQVTNATVVEISHFQFCQSEDQDVRIWDIWKVIVSRLELNSETEFSLTVSFRVWNLRREKKGIFGESFFFWNLGRKATPVCLPLPGGLNNFCGRIYGISKKNEDFKACLGLELRADDEVEAALRVSCFSFGPRGLKVMEAEPIPLAAIDEEDGDINLISVKYLIFIVISQILIFIEDDDLFGLGGTDSEDEDDDDDGDILGGIKWI